MTVEEYRAAPCRAASLPYWKAAQIRVPEGMEIIHGNDFDPSLLERYEDEVYFRLKHDLDGLTPSSLPGGFVVSNCSDAELADHINGCYGDIGVTAGELAGYRDRRVYCQPLWLVVRDAGSRELVASGIGELDRETGEGVLEWIQVSEAHRGRGLGTFLVRELLWRMRGMAEFATVSGRVDNPTNPEGLYRRCGFTGADRWHILRKKA